MVVGAALVLLPCSLAPVAIDETAFALSRAAGCCARGGLALDAGAATGAFSLRAARMGCRTIAWEPRQELRSALEAQAAQTNLTDRIQVRSAVLSNVTRPAPASTETLDDIVHERPCILRLGDGGEVPRVVGGARSTFLHFPPATILAEYSPGVAEAAHQWEALAGYPVALRALAAAGYRIFSIDAAPATARTPSQSEGALLPPQQPQPTLAPAPRLREVTERTLHAEEVNVANILYSGLQYRMRANRFNPHSYSWNLHPHSLRAEFERGTRLLLTHAPKVADGLQVPSVPLDALFADPTSAACCHAEREAGGLPDCGERTGGLVSWPLLPRVW